MKKNIRASSVVKAFLLLVLVFVTPTKSNAAEDILNTIETRLRLDITFITYKAVVSRHFKNRVSEYNPVHLADRKFFLTVFEEWRTRIDSKKFNTTREIFSDIQKNTQFIKKYYGLWSLFQDPHRSNLSQIRARDWWELLCLSALWDMEEKSRDNFDYVAKLLEYILYTFVTEKKDYHFADIFASIFENSKYEEIKAQAVKLRDSFKKRDIIGYIQTGFDLATIFSGAMKLATGGRLFSGGGGGTRATTRFVNRYGARSKPLAFGILGAGFRGGKNLVGIVKNRNPFKANIYSATVISAGLHAGGYYYVDRFGAPNLNLVGSGLRGGPKSMEDATAKLENMKKLADLITLFSNLYSTISNSYPEMEESGHLDFSPDFHLESKDWIESSARGFIDGTNKNLEDFGRVILQAEKNLSVDHRDPRDLMAMDIVFDRYSALAHQVRKIFEDTSVNDKIEAVRKLVLSSEISNYSRGHPSLTSVFLGWGGNCIASTALFVSLLYPYKDSLPDGKKLGVLIAQNHIEPILYDDNKYQWLVAGKEMVINDIALLKPEYLMLLILRYYIPTNSEAITGLIAIDGRTNQGLSSETSDDGEFDYSQFRRSSSALDLYLDSDLAAVRSRRLDKIGGVRRDVVKHARIQYLETEFISELEETNYDNSLFGNMEYVESPIENHLKTEGKANEGQSQLKIIVMYRPETQWINHSVDTAGKVKFYITAHTEEAFTQIYALYQQEKDSGLLLKELVRQQVQSVSKNINHDTEFSRISSTSLKDEVLNCVLSNCPDPQSLQKVIFKMNRAIFTILRTVNSLNNISEEVDNKIEIHQVDQLNTILEESIVKLLSRNLEFLDHYASRPSEFVEFYNNLSRRQKTHLYSQIASAEGLTSEILQEIVKVKDTYFTNFISVLETQLALLTNQQSAYNSLLQSVGQYLYSINDINLIGEDPVFDTPINLPLISAESASGVIGSGGNGAFGVGFVVERVGNNVSEKESKEANDPDESDPEESNSSASQALRIKASSLIELTFLTQAGHHIWTDNVINSFEQRRFNDFGKLIIGDIVDSLKVGLSMDPLIDENSKNELQRILERF